MNKLTVTICVSVVFAIILTEVTASKLHPLGIYGGTDAEDGEFPFMAQLVDNENNFYCGATIIGDKWLLTAGSCVNYNRSAVAVYGTNVLADLGPVNTTIKIKKTYLHPQYSLNTTFGKIPFFDVGIIELEHAIPFDGKAQPVQLANANAQVPYHQNGELAGWGLNNTYGPGASGSLKKITLQLLTDTECSRIINTYFGQDLWNSTNNVCTNDHLNGMCLGDAGGGFVVDGIQYGIASWTYACAYTSAAYTRLTTPSHREFIKQVTGI